MDISTNHRMQQQQRCAASAALPHVQEVLRSAQDELAGLLQQRAEIMQRIGTVKQVLGGMASLFGDAVLSDELRELLEDRPSSRSRGFTLACRQILIQSRTPVPVRYCTEQMRRRFPELADRHKDLTASMNTVLHRLASYGEARCFVEDNGDRVWEWITDGTRNPIGLAALDNPGLERTAAG